MCQLLGDLKWDGEAEVSVLLADGAFDPLRTLWVCLELLHAALPKETSRRKERMASPCKTGDCSLVPVHSRNGGKGDRGHR